MGFYFTPKKTPTSGCTLGHENVISIRAFNCHILAELTVDVPSHSEQRNGSAQFGQNHGIVRYTQTIDLPCKSANLVHVPRYGRNNTVELNSELENLVKIRLLPAFIQYTNGILTLSVVRIPFIELLS